MPETTSQEQMGRPVEPQYRQYGRITSYGGFGVFLLILFLACVVLAYLGFIGLQGPNLLPIEIAIWGLSLVCVILSMGLFFVLFTLRGTLRLVRQQATEVAVMRSLMHEHEPRYAPPPAIEYRTEVPAAPPPAPAAPSRSVESIEGIGPVFARRLERAGVETLRDLRAASTQEVAQATGTPPLTAARWKTMADLMVVSDVDAQAAELLVRCGVRSVDELAAQEPEPLFRKARQTNHANEVRVVPGDITQEMVNGWVSGARTYSASERTERTVFGTSAA